MRILSITAAIVGLAFLIQVQAEEQMSMSEADKKMYAELLESNPAEMDVSEGEQLFTDLTTLNDYSMMLGVKEKDLPKFLAGFHVTLNRLKKLLLLLKQYKWQLL